jgi:hypothetical protein
VVPAEVVVVDEVSESPLQLAGLFIGDLIYLLLDGPVIALQCCQSARMRHFETEHMGMVMRGVSAP